MRKILLITSGNKCKKCNKKLNKSYHADHVIPFSKKGPTNIINAQALCSKCNLKKGASIV